MMRRLRTLLTALAAAALLGGCYVAPLRPPALVLRPARAACWHAGWWGPWGWHPGHWGSCR